MANITWANLDSEPGLDPAVRSVLELAQMAIEYTHASHTRARDKYTEVLNTAEEERKELTSLKAKTNELVCENVWYSIKISFHIVF